VLIASNEVISVMMGGSVGLLELQLVIACGSRESAQSAFYYCRQATGEICGA
jgi:hypothetical protein